MNVSLGRQVQDDSKSYKLEQQYEIDGAQGPDP